MFQETSTFQVKSTQNTQLQAEDVYMQGESIYGLLEDLTTSDNFFLFTS